LVKSKEFTDLNFVAPKAQAYGRPNGDVIWNVIHTTQGSYHGTSAEDGAAYDARRTDSVSAHFFVDSNSTVQCVYTWDRAFTARTIPNNRGVHYELCARAEWNRDTWLNAYGKAMLENAAKITAKVAKKYDIPARWITDAQMRNREKGFTTHAQCSRVLEGTHTDPGPNFPADYFMTRVKYYMNDKPATVPATPVSTPVEAGASVAQSSTAALAAKTLTPEGSKDMHLVQLKGDNKVWLSNLIVRRHVKSPKELLKLEEILGIRKEPVDSLDAYGIEIK